MPSDPTGLSLTAGATGRQTNSGAPPGQRGRGPREPVLEGGRPRLEGRPAITGPLDLAGTDPGGGKRARAEGGRGGPREGGRWAWMMVGPPRAWGGDDRGPPPPPPSPAAFSARRDRVPGPSDRPCGLGGSGPPAGARRSTRWSRPRSGRPQAHQPDPRAPAAGAADSPSSRRLAPPGRRPARRPDWRPPPGAPPGPTAGPPPPAAPERRPGDPGRDAAAGSLPQRGVAETGPPAPWTIALSLRPS
jgi:hypothetical protein